MADTVLIIDADVNSRTVLARSLRSAAIQAETASSGEEVLERLWRVKYDLVVLEIDLPGIDGYHVLQDLRRRYDHAADPAEPEQTIRAVRFGLPALDGRHR